ncbi:MAG: hypothetical protein KIT54_06360 [Phycisphaeraceae bacterium]|nr:hypothetical protein [Phycisphaeraceae bacterium]
MSEQVQRSRLGRVSDPRYFLVALNAGLLLALGVVMLSPGAIAQQAQRPRGEYLIVGGQMTGSPSNAVHVIDTTNQEMITLRWDQARKAFDGLGYRNLRNDALAAGQGGGR